MPSVSNSAGRNLLRGDPTRTTLLRNNFERELRRRIRAWTDDIYYFLVTQDALGLRNKGRTPFLTLATPFPRIDGPAPTVNSFVYYLNNPPPSLSPREFEFRTDPDKIAAFQDWMEKQRIARLLTPIDPLRPRQPWTAKYVQSAYKKGLLNAYAKAKRLDAIADEALFDKTQEKFLQESFNTAETVRKLELLSTRSFEDLKGITADMAGKMNRILAQGMLDGDGPDKIAKAMFEEVDNITKRRAVLVTRTEIINAHAEGQLDSFDELGVESLGVEAEWLTAGDDRVCPQCEDMEGKTFSIEEARGLIPLHPNCRCSWTPAL